MLSQFMFPTVPLVPLSFVTAGASRREVAPALDTSWTDGTAETINGSRSYSQIKAIPDFARREIFCLAVGLVLLRDKKFVSRPISCVICQILGGAALILIKEEDKWKK